MFAQSRRILPVLLAVGLLAAGCSSDDGGTDAATDAANGGTTIAATATEFAFEPNTWTVTAGEEFTVDFTNGGAVEHEWAVIALGEDLESEDGFSEDKVLLEVEAIAADTDTTASFTIDQAGTYQVICALPGHFDAGMEGTLTVQ